MELLISIVAILIILALLIYMFTPAISNSQNIRSQLNLRRMKQKFKSSKHKFDVFEKKGLYYCNVCSKLLSGLCGGNPLQCRVCGLLVHKFCKYKPKPYCKYLCSSEENSKMPHQCNLQINKAIMIGLAGNLPTNAICHYCGLLCTSYYSLEGKSCLWCQKVVHDGCIGNINPQCDLGEFSRFILAPHEINYLPLKGERKKSLDSDDEWILASDKKQQLKYETKEKKSPILVVVNKKSGGQAGAEFLNSFYRYLNPIQIIDLTQDGLNRIQLFLGMKDIKVLVAGGDGTIGSVLSYLKSECPNQPPPVAILPLGTGNDLSRALGWGQGYTSLDAANILEQVEQVDGVILLDRWSVSVGQTKNYTMYNYFSIGLDAKYCLEFHNLRARKPHLFKSRIGNKFIYTHMGLGDFLSRRRSGLAKQIRLYCDEQLIEVPEQVENLVVLNINSWAGGAQNLWQEDKKWKPQRFSDGLVEVIGISSVLQLGKIQVGLDQPYRICQGRCIRVELIDKMSQAIQIDGEPQMIKGPISIDMKIIDKVPMLSNVNTVPKNWEGRLLQTMEWAEEQGMITKVGKEQILEKMLQQ